MYVYLDVKTNSGLLVEFACPSFKLLYRATQITFILKLYVLLFLTLLSFSFKPRSVGLPCYILVEELIPVLCSSDETFCKNYFMHVR